MARLEFCSSMASPAETCASEGIFFVAPEIK
jgi:hypothetical protein